MEFQSPLIPGRLLQRYKRFLADIELDSGETVTAHCANPGAMLGLNMPGLKVWVEPNDDPKKKLKYGWRLIELEDNWDFAWARIAAFIARLFDVSAAVIEKRLDKDDVKEKFRHS